MNISSRYMSRLQVLSINYIVIAENWSNYDCFTIYKSLNMSVQSNGNQIFIPVSTNTTIPSNTSGILFSVIAFDMYSNQPNIISMTINVIRKPTLY